MKKWSTFAVHSPTDIVHEASHPLGGDRMLAPADPMPRPVC